MIRYVDNIPPVWAAWVPTLVFGPIAVALLDNIKT
jgi:lipopolysaccharide export LptBFGC system permease protein LptF